MAIDTVSENTKQDDRDTFQVINPADGSAIAEVPLDGPADVAATGPSRWTWCPGSSPRPSGR